jgi:hypothetical protein
MVPTKKKIFAAGMNGRISRPAIAKIFHPNVRLKANPTKV